MLVTQLCPTLCDPMDCSPPKLLGPWGFPGKSTGVGCHALLQGISLTQGSNPGIPHCRQTFYRLSHQGNSYLSVTFLIWVSPSLFFCVSWWRCFSLEQEHMIQNEVSILRRVKHPNIVLLIEEMDVPTELYLVMELVKVCVLVKEVNLYKAPHSPVW